MSDWSGAPDPRMLSAMRRNRVCLMQQCFNTLHQRLNGLLWQTPSNCRQVGLLPGSVMRFRTCSAPCLQVQPHPGCHQTVRAQTSIRFKFHHNTTNKPCTAHPSGAAITAGAPNRIVAAAAAPAILRMAPAGSCDTKASKIVDLDARQRWFRDGTVLMPQQRQAHFWIRAPGEVPQQQRALHTGGSVEVMQTKRTGGPAAPGMRQLNAMLESE